MSGPAPLACLEAACASFARIGMAVSGGGDSVAALVLAVEVLGPARVAAVTVDHGLRPESAAEAAGVAALCARLGVTHDTLRWAGPVRGNVQAAAREARLALIGDWARGRVDAVVLAHTLDDQAETVLMRLARGSGVDGLAGMAAARSVGGVTWLRPLLGVTRQALRDDLRARGVGWVEDPSNADPRYQRVRARQALAALADLGIDAAGLAATAARLQRARAALEAQAQAALVAHVREDQGTVLIDPALLELPVEIRDRVFAHLVMALSRAAHRPRLADLHRLIAAGQGTLMGCLLEPAVGSFRLGREVRAVADLRAEGGVWDGRWRAVAAGTGREDAEMRALGDAGLARLSRQAQDGLHPHWRGTGLSRKALMALPGLWYGDELTAAPLAFWPQGWRLEARPVAAIAIDVSQSH